MSAEQLSALAAGAGPLYSANWGLATGVVSGVWCVDYDPGHVTDPVEAGRFLLLLQQVGTWSQRTGSGGQHWLFTLPEDFVPNNSAKRLPDGFDVRGARRGEISGGQIVLAPSVSGRGAYEVLTDGPVLPAPAEVVELVRPAPPRERQWPKPLVPATPDQNTVTRYAINGIVGELEALRGTATRRNDRAYAAAARVIELANAGGLDREAVYAAWWAAAATHPDPAVTVPDRELLGVWGSAERRVGDRPADLSGVGGAPGWSGGAGVLPFAAPVAVPPLGLSGSAGGHGGGRGVEVWPPTPAAVEVMQAGGRQLKVTRASEITMRATQWLWEEEDGAQWMPLGGLTLLGGREGIGKSTWAYRLAAMLTVGKLPGSFFGVPRAVVVAATEDAWAQTVVPRLAAAGADLDLVFRVDVVQPDGGMDGLSLPEDIAGLTALCLAERVALVLLDPLLGAVSGRLDTHKDAEVRKALAPLSRLADEARIGVLGLIHVSKREGGDLLTRLMASRAFSAVARSVLVCSREDADDEDEMTGRAESFLFGQAKNNLGRKIRHCYRYVIEGATVGFDATLQLPVHSSRIQVTERVDGGIDNQASTGEGLKRPAPKTEEALRWLTSYLQSHAATTAANGIPSQEVKDAATEAGHSERAIRSAREKNGNVIGTDHNPHGPGTVWFLSTAH